MNKKTIIAKDWLKICLIRLMCYELRNDDLKSESSIEALNLRPNAYMRIDLVFNIKYG